MPGDLELVEKRYQALQANYLALVLEKQQQEAASRQWLEQRTRELEAEALEQKKAETL